MTNLYKIQLDHKQWQEHNFGVLPPEDSLLGIMEELGELSHAFTKAKQNVRIDEDHVANMEDAVGDIAIFLMSFCSSQRLSFKACIENTWDKVKQRDWKKYPEKGVPYGDKVNKDCAPSETSEGE